MRYILFILLLSNAVSAVAQCPQLTYNSNGGTFGAYQISFELDDSYWNNCGTDSNIEIIYANPTGSCVQEKFSIVPSSNCSGGRKQYLSYNGCDYSYCRDAQGDAMDEIVITVKQAVPAKEVVCHYYLKPDMAGGDVKSSDFCQYTLDNPLPVSFRNVFYYRNGCMAMLHFSIDADGYISVERSSDGFHYEPFIYPQYSSNSGKFAFFDCDGAYYRLVSGDNYSNIISTFQEDTIGFHDNGSFIFCDGCGWEDYSLYSLNGIEVAHGSFDGYANLSHIQSGLYVLVLSNGFFIHSRIFRRY